MKRREEIRQSCWFLRLEVIRSMFFASSIVRHWNNMKSSEIEVKTTGVFQKMIQDYFSRQDIW